MRSKEINAVYVAGLFQGLALVAFPAASAIFTNPEAFNFSSTGYGSLFVPQMVTSIGAALYSSRLAQEGKIKPAFLIGLTANLLAMLLLALSALVMHHQSLAYTLLMVATASLGLGFGLTVPVLNTLAAAYFPRRKDFAILLLNALLGIGTALAPVLVALFIGLGFWWGLPLLMAIFIVGLIGFSAPLALQEEVKVSQRKESFSLGSMPKRFWVYAIFALVYGVVETLNSAWAVIYMHAYTQAGPAMISLALTFFWGMTTLGRVFFALVEKRVSEKTVYCVLPLVILISFMVLGTTSGHSDYFGVLIFGLAGLGCSALLPLTISFGSEELSGMSSAVAGGVIAFYLLGYGLAAFGAGPLQDMVGLSLKGVFGFGALMAVVLAILSFQVVKKVNI